MILFIIGMSLLIVPVICYAVYAIWVDPIVSFIKARKRLKENTDNQVRLRANRDNYQLCKNDLIGSIIQTIIIIAFAFIVAGAIQMR